MSLLIGFRLRQNSPGCVVGGVNFNIIGFIRIGHDQYRKGAKHIFECLKYSLALRCPCPGLAFFGEIEEQTGNSGETLDEPAIKVPKAKEGLNILNILRFWPLYNTGNLNRVHAKCVVREDKSHKFN